MKEFAGSSADGDTDTVWDDPTCTDPSLAVTVAEPTADAGKDAVNTPAAAPDGAEKVASTLVVVASVIVPVKLWPFKLKLGLPNESRTLTVQIA